MSTLGYMAMHYILQCVCSSPFRHRVAAEHSTAHVFLVLVLGVIRLNLRITSLNDCYFVANVLFSILIGSAESNSGKQ